LDEKTSNRARLARRGLRGFESLLPLEERRGFSRVGERRAMRDPPPKQHWEALNDTGRVV
jgi:hypothetical protein